MAVFGSGILVCATTGKMLVIGSIIWSVLVALVAFTSPGLRDFVVDNLLPRFRRFVKGNKMIGENEALDRPHELTERGEVPRE
jgi:hypothetical protein